MAWVHANDNTPYDGPTHTLAGVTYTGATRKSDTRRLLFIAEAEVKKPTPKKKPVKTRKVKSNG